MAVVNVRKVDPTETGYVCATAGCDGKASFVETTANPTAFYGVCDNCAERKAMARLSERGFCETCADKKIRIMIKPPALAAGCLKRYNRKQITELIQLLQQGLTLPPAPEHEGAKCVNVSND